MQLQIKNVHSLPFPKIVLKLSQQFANGSGKTAAQSSHWQVYANTSEAWLAGDGQIKSLRGTGFGDYKARPWDWAFGLLNYLTYIPRLTIPVRALLRQLRLIRRLKVSLFVFDSFRQAAIAAFLTTDKRSSLAHRSSHARICLIGDGWGLQAALLKLNFPDARITIVDLGKTLLFSSLFLQDRFPTARFQLAGFPNELATDNDADFTLIPAEDIKNLQPLNRRFDFAMNVASMQEMDPTWISFYFFWLRENMTAENQFYCCNRASKTLPDGTEIRFDEFPWSDKDEVVLDGEPEFYRWFFSIGKTARNVKIKGVRIPFMRLFDGDFRHRLARLARTDASRGPSLV